jgi:hypothetical protein
MLDARVHRMTSTTRIVFLLDVDFAPAPHTVVCIPYLPQALAQTPPVGIQHPPCHGVSICVCVCVCVCLSLSLSPTLRTYILIYTLNSTPFPWGRALSPVQGVPAISDHR